MITVLGGKRDERRLGWVALRVEVRPGYVNEGQLDTVRRSAVSTLGLAAIDVSRTISQYTVRNASSGGVGANIGSPFAPRICLATRRDLMSGFSSSPLLTSTHLTEMGGRPLTR